MALDSTSFDTTVVINGVSYNETVLAFWNYTAYGNGTLSNGSNCFLAFDRYQPILVSPNGTFVNTTSCYQPIHAIRARGIAGLVFGSLFAVSILFSTINLRKHGRSYLPTGKRWRPVGRRWPWYWTMFVAACGLLSCFTAVDVDRDYVVNTPMVLQCFFLTLMVPALLACVWESVRSWTSFQYHRLQEADTFALPVEVFRARVDFYLPLIFYTFDWLVFFLSIPRSWSFVQKQRSPIQTLDSAKPRALDARFKIASVTAVLCLTLITFRLTYTSRSYRLRIPCTLLIVVGLLAMRIGYAVAGSFVWTISPYRLEVSIGWLYGLGYAPILLVLYLLNLRGYLEENEDKIMISQRTRRGIELEEDMHLKSGTGRAREHQGMHPSWWYKTRHAGLPPTAVFKSAGSQLRREPGDTSKGTPSQSADDHDESGHYWWHRRKEGEHDPRLRKSRHSTNASSAWSTVDYDNDHAGANLRWTERGVSSLLRDGVSPTMETNASEPKYSPYARSRGRLSKSSSSSSSSSQSLQSRPQVVRSMLDV
ncbi:hypothetical protein A1O1_00721 [Capronia coronata CBS 617.96]|uniref:Uncharacterized protein n=1 Tax=Capronia coronata CBS 617.96 TaxID=1182541 RepID=W9ZM81_9EURO|nr:uncharacterized protein A1O1_00721 [Capronia coronata CBS 617.96]EXJ95599.1 hypothetical protein A1O1_00721 [Capronia coronata CBS 617.96]